MVSLFKKKPIHADYYALSEEFESSHKGQKFKGGERARFTKYKNIFSKGYTEKWSEETFVFDSVLKTNPWTYKIKDLKRKKIIEIFFEKKCC